MPMDEEVESLCNLSVNHELRIIYLHSDIDSTSFHFLIKALDELEVEKKPITIDISSAGGDIDAMLAIFDRIQASTCEITTVGRGYVQSSAVLVLNAGKVRKMSKNSWLMIHESSEDELSGSFADIKNEMEHWANLEHQMNRMLAERTKGKLKISDIEHLNKKDTYINAEQALMYGLIDEII